MQNRDVLILQTHKGERMEEGENQKERENVLMNLLGELL
jgi:hypothetical protein